jgi:hypothetical protein
MYIILQLGRYLVRKVLISKILKQIISIPLYGWCVNGNNNTHLFSVFGIDLSWFFLPLLLGHCVLTPKIVQLAIPKAM